jgi:hypothetical protein
MHARRVGRCIHRNTAERVLAAGDQIIYARPEQEEAAAMVALCPVQGYLLKLVEYRRPIP